jgi:glycosyltransferase involved in cell wall biosynthesis
MQDVLVSIGLPTFNRPNTLERTLRSIINQTYTNLEIIVSDNCSTDPGVEVVMSKYIYDKRIRYIRQISNIGAILNFNFVLEHSKGEYFMRLGNDDWLEPNYVESCLSYLLENPEYVCVYGHPRIFNLEGLFFSHDIALSAEQDEYVQRMVHYYKNVSQNGPYYGLIRKELSGCVVGEQKFADDWLGVARLCFAGKIKMLENTNLNLSQGGVGSSTESIVRSLGLKKFDYYFPRFSIAINAFMDVWWRSKIYRKLDILKRFYLAWECAKVIYSRFRVSKEIRGSYKIYLKSVLFPKEH